MGSREVVCACGALNDVAFATCIRCGEPVGAGRSKPAPAAPGQAAGERGRRLGLPVLVLGGLCALVFAFQLSMALKHGESPGRLFMSSGDPADDLKAGVLYPRLDLVRLEPYRLFSAMFAHFGLLHFALNMLAFVGSARASENLLGASRTMVTFVAAGFMGWIATLAYHMAAHTPSVVQTAGASGAILGVMGLSVGGLLRRKDPRWKKEATDTLLYAVLFGFMVNAANVGVLVNNAAHIGGLVTGFALGFVWGAAGTRETLATKVGAAVAVILSVGSVLLAATSSGELPLG